MAVHVVEDGERKDRAPSDWSTVVPVVVMLVVIFLSPLIFDLARRVVLLVPVP